MTNEALEDSVIRELKKKCTDLDSQVNNNEQQRQQLLEEERNNTSQLKETIADQKLRIEELHAQNVKAQTQSEALNQQLDSQVNEQRQQLLEKERRNTSQLQETIADQKLRIEELHARNVKAQTQTEEVNQQFTDERLRFEAQLRTIEELRRSDKRLLESYSMATKSKRKHLLANLPESADAVKDIAHSMSDRLSKMRQKDSLPQYALGFLIIQNPLDKDALVEVAQALDSELATLEDQILSTMTATLTNQRPESNDTSTRSRVEEVESPRPDQETRKRARVSISS
jgi:hypothetical protein